MACSVVGRSRTCQKTVVGTVRDNWLYSNTGVFPVYAYPSSWEQKYGYWKVVPDEVVWILDLIKEQ